MRKIKIMEKEKTMREIYYKIKELRKNPTPDNIDKINELYREIVSRHDSYKDSWHTAYRIMDFGTLLALISFAVSFLILCIIIVFLT